MIDFIVKGLRPMRYHGKDEVSGSNPDRGSTRKKKKESLLSIFILTSGGETSEASRGSKFALESAIWRFFLVRSINNSGSQEENTSSSGFYLRISQ